MPILLDPILENNEGWAFGQNWNALDMGVWGFNKNVAGMYGSTSCIYECFPWSGRGLYVSGQSGTYWPHQFAQWSYTAPNTASFVTTPTLAPYVRHDHGCSAADYHQPHDYFGVWGHNQQWVYTSVNSSNQPNPNNAYTLPYSGLSVIFGLGSGASQFSIPCWRDLYAGGAHVWLDDWGNPWIESISGIPNKWVSNETPFTITAVAKDEGLGIKNVRLHHDGGPTMPDIPEQHECAGTRRSPCLTTHTGSFDNIHGGHFFQGERNAWLTATDATGKNIESSKWKIWVDNEEPKMTLEGQFAKATEKAGIEKLRLPVYNFEVQAEDYVPGAQPKELRSGVKNIEVFLDDVKQEFPAGPATCNISGRCPATLSRTYSLALSNLTTSGKHTLKVIVADQVGNELKREIEFEYFPATGMKDEYVMHYFPLPDGQGNEAEEEHPDRPELAVNVMNGNLVYREEDVDVEGTAAVDLEVDRYYNSMLPENEDTEWGDGWTLEQTPELDPIKAGGSQVPNEAEVLDSSGAIEEGVSLPTQAGASQFDPELQATITKKESGGYELTDETGESPTSVAFDSTGQAEALLTDGHAKVDYAYEGGELAEIEVSDPATFSADPAELQIPEPQLITQPTFAGSFGSYGAADGQLNLPGDVAVDSQGNLWVVDKANNRIQKFDSTGKFLAKFGSAGSGDGQFNRPTAIAITPAGDLLVADAGNSRVQRFSSAGSFISKFGSKGTANGQFAGSGPEGLAIDAAGSVWVTDTYGGRIQKFSSTGTFLQSVGTKGSAPGQLGEPTGIDVDPSGKVWVADWQNHRVSIFSATGEFLSSFGSAGSGDGQFQNPDAIEIDNLGNVWVGDQSNNRIQQFDLNGQFKAKFGSAGSGPGQFSFSYPLDVSADSKGNLWVSDVKNHRIQHWRVPVERPAYVRKWSAISPADLAVGVGGNLWVVNRFSNRIQKFDSSGKVLLNVGSIGSGDGQFNRPTAIAVDRDGNLLVTDSNNNRVQKFSPEGQFISKFGAGGTGNGQFSSPEGIATDFDGNVWVADSGNGRIQKFDENGEFLGVVSSKGTEPGQLNKPVGIDVDPEGRLWVADFQNNRVSVFEDDGDFVGDFGTLGTGPGQFNGPSGIEIDSHDNVWVVDQGNSRIQRFDLDGLYVGQFGSKGGGEGQFSFPTTPAPAGIASDRSGRIWVSDYSNHRVQEWMLGHYHAEEPELDLGDGDAKVEVATENDLVTSVAGNAAGTHSYEYEGDFLVSHSGPEGEILYEKNSAGLLSKVTLPNGTWATITYYADKRVQSVTVAPSGANAKTTQFHYQNGPPRRSHVTPPDKPQITYDIADDGSVLKWWHKAQKPEFLAITGSLWNEKEKEVSAGDLLLDVIADSPHGIASIEIIANGNQLVSEKRCEQDLSTPEIECARLDDIWATDAASLVPGILNLEVIVTDRFGDSESERWWVQIPHIPPPVPGYPVPPKFSEIQKFREDFGLEVVFPVANERELTERIFDLINAWHSPNTLAGEVARASWERWGVPLRPEDVAELEYRERYLAQAASLIPGWAASNAPGTYAGFYMDHRSGGLVRVGFTVDQVPSVAQLKAAVGLIAPDRVAVFPYQPSNTLATLEGSLGTASQIVTESSAPPGIVSISLDIASNDLRIGTTEVAATQTFVAGSIGEGDGVVVAAETPSQEFEGRYKGGSPFLAATYIRNYEKACMAGFGAWRRVGTKGDGSPIRRRYVLTAGHCFPKAQLNAISRVARMRYKNDAEGEEIGEVELQGFLGDPNKIDTDAEAIRLSETDLIPSWIYECCGGNASMKVSGVEFPNLGDIVCQSSAFLDKVVCGPVTNVGDFDRLQAQKSKALSGWHWMIRAAVGGGGSDSGGPVWMRDTGAAVGLVAGGGAEGLAITPFLRPPNATPGHVAGIFSDPALSPPATPLHVQVAK
ncbi:MAG: 6-bladed beta-propeller [Actinomycetota bacterium]|nr:6-bladed beta-propeller [Actinomycetota bacterium]